MSTNSYDPRFLLKNLMDNMVDSIYFKDLESRFILVNKATATWHGYASPADAIGKSDFDNYKETDARAMLQAEQQIIKTGKPLEGIEEKEVWKDGRVAWVSTTKMPLRDKTGKIVGTFGVSRDITAQKEVALKATYYAQQIKRIKEEMEEEVRMAAELQKTFFPRAYPAFPKGTDPADQKVQFHHHYRASEWVSGDFCAIRRISETKSGILLCDVMGHGVRAALGTAIIYAMVEELMRQEHNPGDFLERMNELLLPVLRLEDSFMYATACYATFDAATGCLQMANAGHPAPLHFQTEQKKVSWLMDDPALRGPALAIMEHATYPTAEFQVKPSDSVVLYTDGLYEITGENDEEFGEKRLLAAAQKHLGLPLPELFPALIDETVAFSSDGIFDDDVCLVGLTYRESMEVDHEK